MHDGLSGIFIIFQLLQMYFVYKCKRTYIKEVLMGRRKCLIIPVYGRNIINKGAAADRALKM